MIKLSFKTSLVFIFFLFQISLLSQNNGFRLLGFENSPYFDEQILEFTFEPEIKVLINAPSPKSFDPTKKVVIALFALPNGNTTEQTIGKVLGTGDDWHYDIQHIGAQTRFIRNSSDSINFVTVYIENNLLSWPSWKAKYVQHDEIISSLVDSIRSIFSEFSTEVVLTGHSGGGRFIFSFLDHYDSIPSFIKRITFLDSNYGYDNSYGSKFVEWLNRSEDNVLFTVAYNDSIALYNGEPIVSPTGGTWYRSRLMQKYLADTFQFETIENEEFITHTALNGRIKILLKKNPERKILHTVQVERNGFIHSILSYTPNENDGYKYYGDRSYSELIQKNILTPAQLTIPDRPIGAMSGSAFMSSVESLTFAQREARILEEISKGNVPNHLRTLIKIETEFKDVTGDNHSVIYEVMPDYLAIGSDSDYCRIPMGPITAQKIADLFGAILPTSKLVDDIYVNSDIKLAPVTYTPIGNQNELVTKFVDHNNAIEVQLKNSAARLGQLIGGTKKDVVISNKIVDPNRLNHVVIYGWHKLDGTPIQPLTNIHIDTYTDYSHGIRLLNSEILLDGELVNIRDMLKDATLYKILSNETEPMNQPSYLEISDLPSKPESFGFKSVDGDKLQIIIKEDQNVEYYKIYLGSDGINFGNAIQLTPDNLLVDILENNNPVFAKIKAGNTIGESPFSEVLGVGIPPEGMLPKLLIVNGFDRSSEGNTHNFIRQHGKAFYENSFFFNSATNEAVMDGLFNLTDYNSVDYILGEESTVDETFSNNEQLEVSNFLQSGGNLFVSGSEIAWDLDYKGSTSDKSFIWNYLKVKYLADAPFNIKNVYYDISPIAGKYFENIPQFKFDEGMHGTYNVDWPDIFGTQNGGVGAISYTGVDTVNGFAGVYYEGLFPGGSSIGKVLTLGFPFETIYNESARKELAKEISVFFDNTTDVESAEQINSFELMQNYPNPFNPTTSIVYIIPNNQRKSNVDISVYTSIGEKITTLFHGYQNPGRYEVNFDASRLASDIYFYQLTADKFIETKKMILLK